MVGCMTKALQNMIHNQLDTMVRGIIILALTVAVNGFQSFIKPTTSPGSTTIPLAATKLTTTQPKILSPDEIQANVPTILGLSNQHFMSQVLYGVVSLDVPNAVGADTLTAAEIKERLDNKVVKEELLCRSLKFLAARTGLFEETEKNGDFAFRLTPSGALLQTGVDGQPSLACSILHNLEPCAWKTWGAFPSFLQGETTDNPCVTANGMGPFEWFETHPESAEPFNDLMSIYSGTEIPVIVNEFDWSKYNDKTVVDVGGSYGPVMAAVKSKYPDIRTISFDLPSVIDAIDQAPPGVELVSGNFFQPETIPKTDGAIFMKHILHDWSDEDCVKILKSCVSALEKDAKIIVVDAVLPPPGEMTPIKEKQLELDLLMSTFDGKERTLKQWETLADEADLKIQHVLIPSAPIPLCQILTMTKK